MSKTRARKKGNAKPALAISIDDGVDLEAYAGTLAKVIQEVRGENQDLKKRLREQTMESHSFQEELKKHKEQIEATQGNLEKSKEELKKGERMAVLGNLTETVSHELRNPLGALRTAIFMIQNKTKNIDLGLELTLVRANRSIDRCDKIITQMLDFARSTDLDADPAIIDNWLDSILSEQELLDGITVVRENGARDVMVAFESERLRRAVINVFENGAQAIVESMKKDDDAKQHSMTVATRVVGGRYEMSFTDTGVGMDEKTLNKIFDPLFSTKTYGVGLGMPTVRQIMELHDGGVEIESTPGEGTTVTLWLKTEPEKAEKPKT